MIGVYRWLLHLYPRAYRREYADEMISVFRNAHADACVGSFGARISFRVREVSGLLSGAVEEQIRLVNGSCQLISFRRFDMRPEFRFPRSTVVLMTITFAGVILAMQKANTIEVKYGGGADSIWPSLPWFLGLTLLFTGVTVVVVWGILFGLKRTGSDRLANLQPDPGSAE
jgi:hypothetical protein